MAGQLAVIQNMLIRLKLQKNNQVFEIKINREKYIWTIY